MIWLLKCFAYLIGAAVGLVLLAWADVWHERWCHRRMAARTAGAMFRRLN